MDENERGLRDTADAAGAEGDVLKGPPALDQKREAAFSQAAQGSKERVVRAGIDIEFPPVLRLFHGGEYALAGALVAGIGEDRHLGCERPDDIENLTARGLDVVNVSRQDVGDPQRDAFRADDRLDVAAEVVGFPGVPQVDFFALLGMVLRCSRSVSTILPSRMRWG